MPRGGPRRGKPTPLKLLQGTARPDRMNDGEPRPQPAQFEKPTAMDYYAKKAWDRLVPVLQPLGLLTEADLEAFTALCEAYGRYERARRRLRDVRKQVGGDFTMDNVKLIRKTEISVEKAEHSFRLLANEFGLSPAARTRIDVSTGDEDSDFEEFLNRGAGG